MFKINLKIARIKAGKTQEELANLIGTKKRNITSYENGVTNPPYDKLVKIADALDVTTDYLLGRGNNE